MAKRPLSEQLEILAGVVQLIRDELPSDIGGAESITARRLDLIFTGVTLLRVSKELKRMGK